MNKYVEAESVELVYSGSHFFDVLEKIVDESREALHLQTYIFATDSTGYRVIDALKRAAARGVRVFMLVDAYASFPFPQDIAAELNDAGIMFRLFSPLFSSESGFIGRRLHHKVVVADRNTGLIGGINIADKYNAVGDDMPWLDYAVLVRGSVCEFLHILCEQFYSRKGPAPLQRWERNTQDIPATGSEQYVRFRVNDWLKRRNEIHKSYIEGIVKAEKSILIVASYFLPGNNLRRLLRLAAKRGVKITIILAGQSDLVSVRLAENYLYDFYLRHRITLYEWPHSVLHGKAMLVDDTRVTIGSYNLNFLSHYISIELNADVIAAPFVREFSDHLGSLIEKECALIDISARKSKRRFIVRQFLLWLAYSTYRVVMTIALQSRRYRDRMHG
jgi:cardiolipin synthase A/B